MTRTIRRRTLLSAAVATPMLARHGWAQAAYPNKTLRMVVPFAPGGTTDLLGRIAAQYLTETLGQQVVVDNKSGAGGNVGAEIVAKAPPDGYTLLLGTIGTGVTNQFLYKTMPYDSVKSFVPIALFGEVANVLAVNPNMPVKTVAEYVEYCKKQGDNKVSFGSPAVGGSGHLAMEYFESLAGFRVEHVVYRGSSLVLKDLLAGHIPSTMDNLPPYLPHIQSGALRALGVSTSKRWFALPDVPTIAESGYPGFDAAPWWYVAAPAGTPAEIVKKLSDDLVKASKDPEVIKRIRDAGAAELGGSSEDLARFMAAETVKWRKVVEAAKLEPQ
ncbi:Tripartite-type tricarboxylate transporter, receptor component TctC [Enhydrobacter aerosaccus]|uniref:Tripartite-type tricarboxylate transporter, receptor component TctC n=1 Tax=Enhydrobacter aerosaccus TaxID=225324 RepID=A0A1T4SZZ2_9HYPH|nr:tripartite tricarboxylate transporter substrate binding protein [Enhydrobacter aerosaccus]SKA33551.1 Tripartite-type tricarboxylate transporter, receptor component TctC [Enhydrobacter aerosaccus]